MTLPSSSSVRKAVFGVKRNKRAREEEEDGHEEPSTQEQQSSSDLQTLQESQENGQEHQKMSPAKMAQKLLDYQNKVRSCKRLLVSLKREKERDLASLVDQLALLENRLRREQKDIQEQLSQRDTFIHAQRLEIERLYRDNERLSRDNRRLAHKVKKYATAVGDKEVEKAERRVKFCRLESIEDEDSCNSCDNVNNHSTPNTHLVNHASEYLDTECKSEINTNPISMNCSNSHNQAGSSSSNESFSHYQSLGPSKRYSYPLTEAINRNIPGHKLKSDRVLHKPPIAEKPKGLTQKLYKRNPSYSFLDVERPCTLETSNNDIVKEESSEFCTSENLPKSIHLVETETDDASTAASSASEPSSPESTLKATTFKAILMPRHFKEPYDPTCSPRSSNMSHSPPSDSSLELHTSDVNNVKSYIMDEYEVTSGYNSDAVSDHDYENMRFGALPGSFKDEDEHKTKESPDNSILSEKEDDCNNSVICNAIKTEQCLDGLTNEDHNLDSNVEFGGITKTEEGEVKEGEKLNIEDSLRHSEDDSQDTTEIKDQLDESFSSTASDESEESKIVVSNDSARSGLSETNLTDPDHMNSNFDKSLEPEDSQKSEIQLESSAMISNGETLNTNNESNLQQGKEKENLPTRKNEHVIKGYENITRPPMSPIGPGGGPGGQYEKFLEATGLSQKSILTPTRTLINHRSVVKPRDVKHRSKLFKNPLSILSTVQEMPLSQPKQHS